MNIQHPQLPSYDALKNSQDLPRELQAAILKHDVRQSSIAAREGWGATTGGMALTKACMDRLSEAFSVALLGGLRADAYESKLLKVVGGLDPRVLALCTLQHALHGVATGDIEQLHVALRVAGGIASECWAAGLIQTDAARAKSIARRVKLRHASSSARLMAAKREAAQGYTKRDGGVVNPYEVRDWAAAFKVRAGMWAINVLTTALPYILTWREEVTGTKRGAETKRYLQLTDHAWATVDAVLQDTIMQRPMWFPSLTPPKPWTSWAGCGSNDARVNSVTRFLRSRHKETGAAVRAAIKSGQMQPALDAVNALQGTAWALNNDMYDIMVQCYEMGIPVKGLPKTVEKPVKAGVAEWLAMEAPARKLKKMRDEQLRHLGNQNKCDRVLFVSDMTQARELAVVARFWTPMNCDWRGRIYSLSHFNFAREDSVRALFQFADGEPIGEDGLRWLKIHVANCGDFGKISKRPMAERVQWCDDNMTAIVMSVSEPLTHTWWTNADKPFLFLAACRELVEALSKGSAHITYLPVSFDGSCSGLQHLSAMTRASEGSLVNLTPHQLPQDIYATVADLVNVRLKDALTTQPENPYDDKEAKDAKRKQELAELALAYGIDRNDVKRGVMTYAYSSKKFGMACQLQTDLMKPLEQDVLEGKYSDHPFAPWHHGTVERPSVAARFLADHIFESIEAIVHKPAEAMKFLQKLAKALAHEGKALRWTTPVGIPWINRYHDPLTTRVDLWLNDSGVRVRTRMTVAIDDKPEINKDAASNGVAPNFVHALDAAHLLLVASASSARGITSIATVHDSFGCLASRATEFNLIIREQFAEMYASHDVLAEILEQAKLDLTDCNSDRLPIAIEPGPLNLKDIINADFAFA